MNFFPYLTPIPDMRQAVEDLSEFFDQDSKKDVERVGRLMLAARYKINEAHIYRSFEEGAAEAPSANAKVSKRVGPTKG